MNADLHRARSLTGTRGTSAYSWSAGHSIWRTIFIIVSTIFFVELIVMFALAWVAPVRPVHALLDASLVAGLSFVLLNHFVLQPLERSNLRLEAEVVQRQKITEELRIQTAALQAAAHGVMITDRSGNIVFVNPAFVSLTGYAADEALGQSPSFLNSGRHDAAFYAGLWNRVLAGEVWHGEIVNRRKDGTLYTEEQTITPIKDRDGQITHFVAIMADCTERKLHENQLAHQNQQLRSLSEKERRQRQFAEALASAARALNSSLVLDKVLDHILDQALSIVPCRAVVVMQLRGDQVDVVRHRDRAGVSNALVNGFHLDQFPGLRTMAEHGDPILIADTEFDPRWTDIPGLEWIRSLGVAPLIEGSRVTGFLAFVSDQAGFIDDTKFDMMVAFAAQAAMALLNARLFDAELSARHVAETLTAASLELSRTLDLHAVLSALLLHLRKLVAYDGAHVGLLGDDGRLWIAASHGDDPVGAREFIDDTAVFQSEGCVLLHTVLREKQSLAGSAPWPPDRSAYVAALADHTGWIGVPIIIDNQVVGLCGLVKEAPHSFKSEDVRLAEVLVAQAMVSIHNATLFQEVKTGRSQLQSLSHRLVQVQENERRVVARELHDQAGQVLLSLKMGLHRLRQENGRLPDFGVRVTALCDITDSVLEDLHRLAVDLRPATLDHLGLVAAIRDHVATINQQHELHCRFEAVGFEQQARLDSNIETSLYRIVQESLTNVIRHARASRADVLLHLSPDTVRLVVEDDGVGFIPAAENETGRLGLVGMRERCEMLEGTLEIESAPGLGTTLVAELPYQPTGIESR
ncbi:MAG: PAS domain S-box protein [Caldilineaceae bacterium]|nr:PAS domain S-box protein [Caldilineaceae bacterium]